MYNYKHGQAYECAHFEPIPASPYQHIIVDNFVIRKTNTKLFFAILATNNIKSSDFMMVRVIWLMLLLCVFLSGNTLANNDSEIKIDKDSVSESKQSNNDPIISTIDSLLMLKYFETSDFSTDVTNLNKYNYEPDYVPEFASLVLECRLMELNMQSPVELDYNEPVQRYIDVYTINRRDQLSRMLGLAELYFPIFEEELDKRNLPLELKYLAIVESALNPFARSKSGAVGLWQFLYNSGKMFDLQVDSYIDERRDPYKSTKAACAYLEYLYRIFDDWQLALAAYNGGPGTIRNAIKRSGGETDFWKIRPYLPKQTQNYVPAFIAVNYAMNFAAEHNIYPTAPDIFKNEIDTVNISHPVYFSKISEVLNIPVETLKFLNPSFKQEYIPKKGKSVSLVLPMDKIVDFIEHESEICGFEPPKNNFITALENIGSKENKTKITHCVKKGEYFHQIAMKYECTIDDIKVWNSMPSNYIYMGKKLDIWVAPDIAEVVENVKKEKLANQNTAKYIYYTVKEGDTLWKIASKFDFDDITEIKSLNNINDENSLHPGKKLKIITDSD